VVLYGCETWSLALREEERLRLFDNRLLRRIFGPKRDEVTGGWRNVHNVLFANYNWNDQVKKGEMGRVCSTDG
jgi:hypothetical protein